MRQLLSLFPKPSRYLGNEEGSVHKPTADIRLRVGLAFPDMYEVGMSYLGLKILYGIVNEREEWLAERVFTPCREAGAILREHHAPLCTLETDTPLGDLDVLGFSVTHELCYSNILYMLDLAGIPLRATDRARPRPDGRPWPLIVAGGGCTLAAEPLAPFVDLMNLGEGEAMLPEMLDRFQAARERGLTRQETLEELSRVPGIYVPEFFSARADGSLQPLTAHHTHAVRRVIPDMNDAPYPVRQPIAFGAVHNRLALEIGRGCTRGCRFCQAGSLYRPARERDASRLRGLLDSCLAQTGFDDVSFLSLSTGDFSALKELFMGTVDRCAREQVSVSLPSLRVGSIDDAIMERMAEIRRTGATLAPEAGSQRLRDVINKGISEQDVILHVRKLFEHGWQQIKLYFMIGLPTETDDDLLAIVDLCRKARDAAGPGIKRLQITASISPFVPKPHTPFQWEAQISLTEIRRRIGLLLDAVRQEKRIKLRWHEPEMSLLEGVFSRGDRRLADVVESAYRKGAIFTSWIEGFTLEPWLEALQEHGLEVEEFTRARAHDQPLPWDHLRSGLGKEYFLRELTRSMQGKSTSDCRYTTCHACGVCDTKAAPSGLERLASPSDSQDGPAYRNILNKPERDQQAHGVALDEHGRVIVREEHRKALGLSGPQAAERPADACPAADSAPAAPSPEHGPKAVVPGLADAPSGGETGKDLTGPDAIGPTQAAGEKTLARKAKARPPALPPHLIKKAAHFRFEYARKGLSAYLSQLEVQHIFDRAMRRAGLPLSFSQGFHPLPLVSFGRALPVGVASECEWFSVFLREVRPLRESLEAINASLPNGMRVLTVESHPLDRKCADVTRERFRLEFLGPAQKATAFERALGRIAQARTIPWRKESKKGYRDLDARIFFVNIEWNGQSAGLLELDWADGYVSPLALCLHALEAVGLPLRAPDVLLTKIAPESR